MKQVTYALATLLAIVSLGAGNRALGVDTSKVKTKNPNDSRALVPATGSQVPLSAAPRSSGTDRSRNYNRRFRVPDPIGVNRTGEPRPTTRVAPIRGSSRGSSRVAPDYVPPRQGLPIGQGQSIAQPRWRLGFYPKEAEVGVGIAQIIRGSAAERGGLEVGDLIVAVAGHQVGYVDGTHFDCADEFEHHADENGWVTLLVQDNRTSCLVNLPIQLDGRQSKLKGNITYRERYALPHNALVTIELREILRPGVPPITLAQETMRPTRHVPIPFSIDYDPSQIDRNRTYVLHAKITSGNRVLFITRRNVPVLSGADGASSNVNLLVESATAFPSGGGEQPAQANQIDQVAQWFREYLHRDPRASELYVWKAHLERGGSLADAQSQLLSTPEFYYQSNANDRQYITRMHELVVGQRPSQDQLNYWIGRLGHHNNLRSEVVREFLANRKTRR